MGILNLFKVPIPGKDKTIGDIYDIISFDEIKNKTLGVDGLNMVFSCIGAGLYLSDSSGRYTAHIHNLLNKLLKISNKQIWVFDNRVKLKTKSETIKKRNAYKAPSEDISIKDAIRDFKTILDMVGIPYIISPEKVEAEFYLCELKRHGVIDLIFSKDTDVLAKGFDLMYFSSTTKEYRYYKISNILKELNFKQIEFLKLCCMLGTDFNKKTVGVSHLKMMDNLHLPLTAEQSVTFNMYQLHNRLHYEDNIDIIKSFMIKDNPNLYNNKELNAFLTERDFKKLISRLIR